MAWPTRRQRKTKTKTKTKTKALIMTLRMRDWKRWFCIWSIFKCLKPFSLKRIRLFWSFLAQSCQTWLWNLVWLFKKTPQRQHKAQVETVAQILLFFCDHNLELETEMRFSPKCLIIVDYPTLVENYWRSIKLQFWRCSLFPLVRIGLVQIAR